MIMVNSRKVYKCLAASSSKYRLGPIHEMALKLDRRDYAVG